MDGTLTAFGFVILCLGAVRALAVHFSPEEERSPNTPLEEIEKIGVKTKTFQRRGRGLIFTILVGGL